MVYSKKHISLFKEGNSVPIMLVTLEKRADKLYLRLSQNSLMIGKLFLYSAGKYLCASIDKPKSEFLLNGFSIDNDFIVSFLAEGVKLVGRTKLLNDENKIIKKFEEKYALIMRDAFLAKKLEKDPNFVVDSIIKKIFIKPACLFFDQTKNQLSSLFASSKRAMSIEAIIPSSKFIFTDFCGERAYLGVVYKNNLPFAIGIGYSQKDIGKLASKNSYQYFYNGQNEGYFLSFRRASDGDLVEI